jgi:hypothetical protein
MTTWNPSDKSSNITLTNANLRANPTTTADGGVRSTTSQTSGAKFYFEVTGNGTGGTNTGCGITTSASALGSIGSAAASSALVFQNSGNIWINGSNTSVSVGAIGTGTVSFAIDLANARLWIRRSGGNWNNSGTANPATNTGGLSISALFPTNPAFAVATFNTSTAFNYTVNFGASAFAFAVPIGFSAWDPIAATQTAVTINTG